MKTKNAKTKKPSAQMIALATGCWALEKCRLDRMLATDIKGFDLDDLLSLQTSSYEVNNGVAVIDICGTLTKQADIFTLLFGGTSTIDAKENLQRALADDSVKSILIYVDSPGGSVYGVGDLAQAIAESSKPVVAYISDLGASAAYWIASQADEIYANKSAMVGSIGVYAVVADTSEYYAKYGIKVQLVKAGEHKGDGVDGVPLSDDAVADMQREIDSYYALFVDGIAKGRGMSAADAKAVATGQVWIADEALAKNLIDGIDTIENVMAKLGGQMAQENSGGNNSGAQAQASAAPVAVEQPAAGAVNAEQLVTKAVEKTMADERKRLSDILALCKNDSAFALEQFAKGNDLAKATTEYAAKLERDLAAAKTPGATGTNPVGTKPADERQPNKKQLKDLFKPAK